MNSGLLLKALRFAPIGIALIDPKERYLYASGAYSKRLGLSSEAIVGMPVKNCMEVAHYERHIGPRLRDCLKGEYVSYQIERIIDGTDSLLSVRYIPCLDANEKVWAVLNIGVDITSDCLPVSTSGETLHKSYYRRPDAKVSTYLDTQDIQAKLEHGEHLSSIGRALAMQSHELRNPLSTLAASLKLLQHHLPDTPEVSRILSRSERAMQRCENVISSLLDYSKPFPLHSQQFNLDDWVSTVISDLRAPDSVDIIWKPRDSGVVWLDDELMRRAVTNLLDNAIREVMRQPQNKPRELRIDSHQEPDRLRLLIADSGSGFPIELHGDTAPKKQIFDHHNAGFGLLIARQIIERHGGRLILKSGSEGGAVAEIQLPKLLSQAS